MDLRTYIDGQRGRAAAIAADQHINPVMVSQWASGIKGVPAERCAAIEAFTENQVMRWDLRPRDWYRIWPELVGCPGAPELPDAEAAERAA